MRGSPPHPTTDRATVRGAPSTLSVEAHSLACRALRSMREGRLDAAHQELRDSCDALEQGRLSDPLYPAVRTALEALARLRTFEAQVTTIDRALAKERRRLDHDNQLVLVRYFRRRQ
mgnify:CR=1 FL=1